MRALDGTIRDRIRAHGYQRGAWESTFRPWLAQKDSFNHK